MTELAATDPIGPSRLALFDLDNTLIDRRQAFRQWAELFVQVNDLGDDDEVVWLEQADTDGFKPREDFFEHVKAHYGLSQSLDELLAGYAEDYPRQVVPPPKESLDALRQLRAEGWGIGIVTNGPPSQLVKIDNAGLAELVDGWAISALVGCHKPEPAIFRAAATACGAALVEGQSWMVGDTAAADIAGAAACGLTSVWIHRGRQWSEPAYAPDFSVGSVAEAVDLMRRS